MPYARKDLLTWQKGMYYHIYNRGVSQSSLFREKTNYLFVLEKMQKYRQENEITFIAYSLMPTHYHFLLRQDGDFPAGNVPQAVFNSYSKAYNLKYAHSGTLFEGRYRAKPILSKEYLLHLCRYGYGNPVKYTDPSGFCANCYVFFFPGAGNPGNANSIKNVEHPELGGSVLDDDLSELEGKLIGRLRSKKVVTTVVYPYGYGSGGDSVAKSKMNIFETLSAAYQKSMVPTVKAYEILATLLYKYDLGCIDDKKLNVMFIGYSGGGQMAYSTAQSLQGLIYVDNIVMFGAPFRAYSRGGNIGHIWSFFSDDDPVNNAAAAWIGEGVVNQTLSLPPDKNTFCFLGSPEDSVSNRGGVWGDHHYYFDSYKKSRFTGATCSGSLTKIKLDTDISRLDAMANLIMRILEGGITE